MANKLKCQHLLTQETLYAVLSAHADTTHWNDAAKAMVAYDQLDWADYAVPMAELAGTEPGGPGSGMYWAAVPAQLPAGLYDVVVRRRAGGSPSYDPEVDRVVGASGTNPLWWDGTNLLGLSAVSSAIWSAATRTLTSVPAVTLADDAITAAKIAAGAITSSECPALANLDAAVSTIFAAVANLNNLSAAQATASVTTALTTALAESYRGTGQQGSAAQLLYEILQNLVDFSNSGVTRTIRNIAGSPVKTYTYNNGANPTSITETT